MSNDHAALGLLGFIPVLATGPLVLGAEALVATVTGPDLEVDEDPVAQVVRVHDRSTGDRCRVDGALVRDRGRQRERDRAVVARSRTRRDRAGRREPARVVTDRRDVTIASYPLQDATEGFAAVDGNGSFTWTFSSISGPWIAGLSDVSYHLTTAVPDVVAVREGSTATGPAVGSPVLHRWSFRPRSGRLSRDDVSGLGRWALPLRERRPGRQQLHVPLPRPVRSGVAVGGAARLRARQRLRAQRHARRARR